MKFIPRYYQTDCLNAIIEYIEQNSGKNPLAVLCTAAGKSFIQAMIVQWMLRWDYTRVLLLTHRKTLIEQNYNKFLDLMNMNGDLFADVGIYSAGLKKRETKNRIIFAGIQSVYKKAWHLGFFDLILIDEVHRVPKKSMGTYRSFLSEQVKINPKVVIVGLTATEYRTGSGLLHEGEDRIFHGIAYKTDIPELIDPNHFRNRDKKQYISNMISKNAVNQVDLKDVHIRAGEYVKEEMQQAFRNDNLVARAVKEITKLAADRKKILVFTAGCEHCEEVCNELNNQGIPATFIHSKQSQEINDKNIDDYKKGIYRALVNIDILTEGFDEPGIDCICLLRSMRSPGLFVQICVDEKTEILTKRGFLKYNEISYSDTALVFDYENNVIEESSIDDIIIRKTKDSEYFYSATGPQVDFKITNNHDLIVKTRHGKIWKKENIDKIVNRKDMFCLPVSAIQKKDGLDLTNDEIIFLGWFYSDANYDKSNNAITITQSMTNKHYIDEIKTCLNNIGFKYGKYIRKRKLEKYINKEKILPDIFENINEEQMNIFIETINKGNGSKRKKINYKQQTYTICFGNRKKHVEKLQSLLIRKGFRCNLSIYHPSKNKWNNSPQKQYILNIKKVKYITISGTNVDDGSISNKKPYKRTRITKEKINKPEITWCIKNKFGTIITRRNGKVLIMGNCGRGFRLHPDKENCLILDFGGNLLRFGPVDKIEIRKKKDSSEKVEAAPQKECPECQAVLALAVMVCPTCGYQFPQKDQHGETASEADIISKWIPPETIDVEDIYYSRHKKKGKPDSLRVDYSYGLMQHYSVWVCIEHEGFAQRKAQQWLRQRIDKEINTVEEALECQDDFKIVKQIIVNLNGQFPEITGYIFETDEEFKERTKEIEKKFDKQLEELIW